MQPAFGVSLVLLLSLVPIAARAAGGDPVTIYRDSWGVPHVYADTEEAAAYGHGYAQAEDRLQDLLAAQQMGLGRVARIVGESGLALDRVARIARHAEIARERYDEQRPTTRRILEHFVAGVRAYMREHPEELPVWAEEPEPYHVVALYRAFAWAWPWGQAAGDLEGAGSQVTDGRGSNQWVVGPERSASGASMALIDPHLRWDPQNRLYEAHVHGGALDFYGYSVIGTPIMALGHTDVFSLALTTGGPDCSDVYEEKIHPENPLLYEYDGSWRSIEVEETTIEVRTRDGMRIEPFRIERTHHGPILERRGDRAYAVRTAYDREIGIPDQWLAMLRARDLDAFVDALRENQSLPQNVMYADVTGNIYYVRAGRVPIRPAGFEWDRPVPGWTSDSEWRGIHALDELVQIVNPPAGFIQNCNVSPDVMMPESPLTFERYPAVIYNSPPNRWNTRGRRALELLDTTRKLTLGRARSIALDTYATEADLFLPALFQAHLAHRDSFLALEPALRLLRKWDRTLATGRRAGPLFRFWMGLCRESDSGVPPDKILREEPLSDAEQTALLQALERAVLHLESTYGRIDVPWGDLHRIGRGAGDWPVAGCRADGVSTLRSVRYADPDEEGRYHASGGQLCTTLVVLKAGAVSSYSATPYGQSDDPASAHYDDQAEKLFSRGRLRPTWYAKRDLSRHLESTRTLTVVLEPAN